MAQYAEDAATNEKPWELWELSNCGELWSECDEHPHWRLGFMYRRKPKTIRIGNYDVPEPMREAPKNGTPYYFVALDSRNGFEGCAIWTNNKFDVRLLQHGQCHLTEDAAQRHAKALIELSRCAAADHTYRAKPKRSRLE